MTRALEPLFRYLDRLRGRPPLAELTAAVAGLDVAYEDLAPWAVFSDRGYTRNLVHGGDGYHVLVLCWKNGQRSPIHDHAGSSCCVRVLRGTLTETRFAFAPNGHVKALSSQDYPAGAVISSEDTDLHQVSNLQPGTAELVTLHVYAPPLRFMGTYSLTDRVRGQEPMFVEFCDAAGI
jgi:cysteine dioxygenase